MRKLPNPKSQIKSKITNPKSRMNPRRLVPRSCDVLGVSAGIHVRLDVGAALASELENLVAEAAEKRAIVRHEEHRALELRE